MGMGIALEVGLALRRRRGGWEDKEEEEKEGSVKAKLV